MFPKKYLPGPQKRFILIGNQKSGNISLFKIDEKRGLPIEPVKDYKITSPACLRFSDTK